MASASASINAKNEVIRETQPRSLWIARWLLERASSSRRLDLLSGAILSWDAVGKDPQVPFEEMYITAGRAGLPIYSNAVSEVCAESR